MDFYGLIGAPLGWIMWLCYQITKNYAVALLLFTLVVRGALLPFSFKQQKSSVKMAMIQPQMKEIQKKYANNREKLAEEMNKLYQKEGYNPASGCLPLLIQFPILFGLIDVIYRPIKHILHLPTDLIQKVEQLALDQGLVASLKGMNPAQIRAVQAIHENAAPWVQQVGQESVDRILTLNLNFLGMDLGQTPSMSMFGEIFSSGLNPLIFIPILSGLSALVMSFISIKTTAATSEAAGGGAMKGMMMMMPIMSFGIAFTVPAGVGLYWFYSNLYAIAQSLILNKFYNPKEMAEKAKKEMEERQEKERLERIEEKKIAKEKALEAAARGDQVVDEKALSPKEINRRKLAEARRRDAERYGEEYVEVTDEDLR